MTNLLLLFEEIMKNEITVDGTTYVRKDDSLVVCNNLEYCIVRTRSAGVFAGFIGDREGQDVRLLQARRLWYWSGAASLSQLAVDGVSKPDNCKFPCEVPYVLLTEVIEILPVTQKAKNSIDNVKVWSA